MSEGLWDLAADPAQIEAAATAWSDLARGIGSIADDVAASMKSALVGWEGEAAEAYDERRLALVRDLDEASAVAGAVATAMQSVAGSVTAAQGQLDTSWASVMSLPRSYLSDDSIWFTTGTVPLRSRSSRRYFSVKFDTPIDRTRPSARACTIAFQASKRRR